jgi:hypothetical protein
VKKALQMGRLFRSGEILSHKLCCIFHVIKMLSYKNIINCLLGNVWHVGTAFVYIIMSFQEDMFFIGRCRVGLNCESEADLFLFNGGY